MRAEMHAQHTPAALGQHLEVAARLRRLDDGEGEFLPGDRKVVGILAGDLQEHAGVWTALVGLPGRMEEGRSKAEAGGDPLAIADHAPDVLQCIMMLLVAFDIGKKRAIISGLDPLQVRREIFRQRTGTAESVAVPLVGKKRNAILGEEGRCRRQFTAPFVGGRELARLRLARLDVRLVERIDAEDPARTGRGDLPTEEFLPKRTPTASDVNHAAMLRWLQGQAT